MNIVWAYAPLEFSLEYSNGGKFKLLRQWRNSKAHGNKIWWDGLFLANRKRNQTFPAKIIFQVPVFATSIRIKMRGPVNKLFGIYKVSFFTKNTPIIIKKKLDEKEKCAEYCWVVNSIVPKPGDEVKRN